jgi:DNA replication and repair protein RecF
VYIKKLRLSNFRNFISEEVSFDRKINLITGKNGQGKTNLIEGIYILSMGKSFRTLKDEEMIRFGEDTFFSEGTFFKREEKLVISIGFSKENKKISVDGSEQNKNSALLENAYIVTFSPEDLKIIKEDPDKRRRFMNREIFQLRPLYYIELNRYTRTLKNRNHLLKEKTVDENLLEVYDEHLAENGAKVMIERAGFVRKINEISVKIGAKISGQHENILIEYEPNIEEKGAFKEQREEIKKALLESRERDLFNKTTYLGPHKDDLKITANGVDLRHFGSQGQQRTAALSLKLAEVTLIKNETGTDAIILLDDVLSELDQERQQLLVKTFEENQVFITAADSSMAIKAGLSEGKTLTVENGHILNSPHTSHGSN